MRRSVDRSLLPTWLLDELRSAGRENLDTGHVAVYDDKENANAPVEVERLLRLGLDARSTVVDLVAGTGQFTLEVAAVCASVVAVDVSPVMLDRLAAKADAAGCTNVEVVQAGFLSYEHTGARVDFVYSRWALHHLADFWKAMALDRVRKILRPRGVLRLLDIAYSFEPSEISDRVCLWRSTLPIEASTASEWVQADIDEAVYSADGFYAEYVARAV